MWYNGLKVDAGKLIPLLEKVDNSCLYVYFRLKTSRASDSGSPVSLTSYRIYKVVKYQSSYAFITNDKGQLRQYKTSNFGKLPDNIVDILDKESLRDAQIKKILK